MKLTDAELAKAVTFMQMRDRHAYIMGQRLIAFEKEKAHHLQALAIINDSEQKIMSEIAIKNGIDPAVQWTIDYKTGEIIIKG